MMRNLHPVLDQWMSNRFPALTEIQKRALPHTLAGRHTLILAPTGNGKTLAAFLSVLSSLAKEAESKKGLPNAVRAVYVSPLKSLGRDMLRNLSMPLDAINATLPANRQIRMEVRTGDTQAADRDRQQRHRPHLLLTTPESLSSLLSQTAWRSGGLLVQTAVVDEIHAFAENKRGSLLALGLERLEAISKSQMQRIGLSATAWPIEAMTGLLCGDRPCKVAQIDMRRAHRLDIAVPPAEHFLPAAGYGPTRVAFTVADLVKAAQCSLVFTTTRSAAERLGLALGVILEEYEERIAVHHASIERETRLAIEDALAQGTMKAVVASSSLELGVDFAAVDQVLLIGAPRGVSKALQRLGRSGRRVDGIAAGALVPLSLPDVLECIAIREGARTGRLDSLRVPQAPLDVLAQVVLGMSIERTWTFDEAYALVRRAGPYRGLSREDFETVLRYLAGEGKVLSGYGPLYGKIVIENGNTFRVATKRVAREYYMNIGVISDDIHVKVLMRGNRKIGEVEEGFIANLRKDEAFTLGGKSVKLTRLHQDMAIVEPATGERVTVPRWMGQKMPLSMQLAREELELRQTLRDAWQQGKASACKRALKRWNVTPEVAERVIQLVSRQNKAAPVPVDSPVQIERVHSGRTMMLLVHVIAGRAVNRSLAWVAAARLSPGGSVDANFDDHSLLLSMDARKVDTSEAALRAAFDPANWIEDLQNAVTSTEALGRSFRSIAEIGQLLPRVTIRGKVATKSSTWNASLLYKTFLEHEPGHPLVRECVRVVLEDECDGRRAHEEAKRIFASPFEVFDHPRPSPFALPLFSAFNRETLMAQDPERALDDLVNRLFEEWK
ncbi:helicase [Bryobacterales bacterium F-183]|nr:helicase [Bryobacterales bacterium F-183]